MIQITKHNTAPTFNIGNGVATLDINNGNENGRAMQIQSDGKIVVAGTTGTGSATKLLLTRYNIDGSPDTSFGAGKGYVNVAGITQLGNEIVILADGKIVVNGWNNPDSNIRDQVILRFNSDGSFDTKFPILSTNGNNQANENAGVVLLSNGDLAFADSYQYSNSETHVRYGQRNLNGTMKGSNGEFNDFKSTDIFQIMMEDIML